MTVQSLHQQASAQLARLSLREYRVLQRVVAGDSNKIIASRLGISRKTVEKHRGRMMRKLDVRTVPGLMIAWLRACPHELYSQTPDDGLCGG